jgi:hypothetical protein
MGAMSDWHAGRPRLDSGSLGGATAIVILPVIIGSMQETWTRFWFQTISVHVAGCDMIGRS